MVLLKIVTYGGGIFLMQDKYKYTDVSERNRSCLLYTSIIFEYICKIPMGFYNIPIIVAFLAAILVAVSYTHLLLTQSWN